MKRILFSFLCLFSFNVSSKDLLEIYQLALENNPTLKQSFYTQNAINELGEQGLARLLPTISFSASTSKEFLFNQRATYQGTGSQDYWSHNLNLNFKQPLVHYDYWIQLSQADNQIAQALADYEAEQQNVALRVVDAYFRVLAAQDNVFFMQAEKQAISRQLEQAKQKFNVGMSGVTEIHEAQAVYDRTIADEVSFINQLDNEKQSIIELMGNDDVQLKAISDLSSVGLTKPNPLSINSWEKTADSNNLSLISLSNYVEVARKTIEVQKSGHLPQVDLVASYSNQDSNSTFGLRGDTQDVGLQLNVPIFSGGYVNSRTRQANFEFEASKEKLSAAKRAVNKEVNIAYRGVMSSISKAEALKTAVTSAEAALEATSAGLEVGTRTIVEVLLAERNLYKAKRDYAQSIYDYLVNTVKLKHAISDITKVDLEHINKLLTKAP